MANTKKIFISSTALDLREYRDIAIHACQRLGFLPIPMEEFGPDPRNAVEVCRSKVEEADLYLGIFAHRYGYAPDGYDRSITEMEYDWAIERGLPALIFMVDDDFAWSPKLIDRGASYEKLERFKARLRKAHVVRPFKDPDQFREDLFLYLPQWREERTEQRLADVIHYVGDIPKKPEPYIAHPYSLLQARGLVGRYAELSLLTDWVTKPDSEVYRARILNVVAIGGMGKSALTWKWFNEVASNEMKPLAGRLWWSFYESDASFENFVVRALSYVTERPKAEVQKILAPEREAQLLQVLDRQPFLLALDGLERILIAYARKDAARLQDSEVDDHYQLRKTADPRAGNFLRKLAQVRASRVLISTRLYPADLQDRYTGDILAGSYRLDIAGIDDGDALELWRSFGVRGSRDDLLRLFHSFDNHPLMIKILAGEVKRFRRAPGDFDQWRAWHKDFDPYRLPQVQDAMVHVLSFALQSLDEARYKTLHTIAAFRMPATYDTLAALLVSHAKLFADETALDGALSELEDRGLLGWDTRANRYDLHPIVRGVVWSRLDRQTRQGVYEALRTHFDSVPKVDEEAVESIDELTPTIELYNALISLERYQDAWGVFEGRFGSAAVKLGIYRQLAEWLEMLFAARLDQKPQVENNEEQGIIMAILAYMHQSTGQPLRAIRIHERAIQILDKSEDHATILGIMASSCRLCGKLWSGEAAARRGLIIDSEDQWCLESLGLLLASRGGVTESDEIFGQVLSVVERSSNKGGPFAVWTNGALAQQALWIDDSIKAQAYTNRAWQLAPESSVPGASYINAARLQGLCALARDDFQTADERLHLALTRARAVSLVEEEIQSLVGLAELRRRQGDLKSARDYLDDLWELAERGPYPLFHADALNVLAQIERDAGNTNAAIDAATQAYRLAWCDGPPFAYHWGLEAARRHLQELGAPEPALPPFDESQHEPMPEVVFDPPDEDAEPPDEDVE
jgi:tetratricopeptide (TPR) repeat protein